MYSNCISVVENAVLNILTVDIMDTHYSLFVSLALVKATPCDYFGITFYLLALCVMLTSSTLVVQTTLYKSSFSATVCDILTHNLQQSYITCSDPLAKSGEVQSMDDS